MSSQTPLIRSDHSQALERGLIASAIVRLITPTGRHVEQMTEILRQNGVVAEKNDLAELLIRTHSWSQLARRTEQEQAEVLIIGEHAGLSTGNQGCP